MTQPSKVVLAEKFSMFHEHWSPKVVAELNGQHVKVARLLGEFDWHAHEEEDELFWVVEGQLELQFRDRVLLVEPGELVVVPRGVEHRPVCAVETLVVLFEPASTINTGDVTTARTRTELETL